MWKEPVDYTPYIIGGSVGGFIFVLLLILLIVWICWCIRDTSTAASATTLLSKSGHMVVPVMNPAYEALPASVIAKPATRYAGSNFGSTMLLQQPATQAIIADQQSLAGYSTLGNQQYVFYQDPDDDAPMVQNNVMYGTYNADPYEEKVSAINIQ